MMRTTFKSAHPWSAILWVIDLFTTAVSTSVSNKILKATSHLTISMHRMRAKGKIQRNNYKYEQRRPSLWVKRRWYL